VAIHTVGIISAGDMGAAIGNTLAHSGLDVITALDGRSHLSRTRASESGMRDVGTVEALAREADIVLSVLVPAEAERIAESVISAMAATGERPTFVDCNAIAPQTVARIAKRITAAGATFIDAGIIGSPPKPGGHSTRFHCSGPDTSAFEALSAHGLDVRRVGPNIGQASGLKMVYAATTKGTYALWTELLVAARALDLDDALRAELGEGVIAQQMFKGLPDTPRRARRWVGEMEEIALTFQGLGLTPKILQGAADMFRLESDTPLGDLTSRDPEPALADMLAILAAKAAETIQ
jgi:3-hydroxyisobutyrate dehydrogenase-like beta-hydroxyacid dehydrogenase